MSLIKYTRLLNVKLALQRCVKELSELGYDWQVTDDIDLVIEAIEFDLDNNPSMKTGCEKEEHF